MKLQDISNYFNQSAQVLSDFGKTHALAIQQAGELIVQTFKGGNKVLIAGNGGSAADTAHRAAELTGRYKIERQPLPAISLPTNMSAVTAIGNDYGFEYTISRELEALGNVGDLFIGISTSGNSMNIINAISVAKQKNINTLLLLGKDGGNLKGEGNLELIVPCNDTPQIQQCHEAIYHTLCQIVDDAYKQ